MSVEPLRLSETSVEFLCPSCATLTEAEMSEAVLDVHIAAGLPCLCLPCLWLQQIALHLQVHEFLTEGGR